MILNVTAIFAQMDGDAISACRLAEGRRLDRVGLVGASRLPDGGHMVDIDVEPERCHCSALREGLTSPAIIFR
jgi:hypothetical protein